MIQVELIPINKGETILDLNTTINYGLKLLQEDSSIISIDYNNNFVSIAYEKKESND